MTHVSIFVAMDLEKSIHNMTRSQLLIKMKGHIMSHKNTCETRSFPYKRWKKLPIPTFSFSSYPALRLAEPEHHGLLPEMSPRSFKFLPVVVRMSRAVRLAKMDTSLQGLPRSPLKKFPYLTRMSSLALGAPQHSTSCTI